MDDESIFILANNIQDLVIENGKKIMKNAMQLSDLATMNAEEKKLKAIYEVYESFHNVLKSKCMMTFRMCSANRKAFMQKVTEIDANNYDPCSNIVTRSKTRSIITKKHESEELVNLIEDSNDDKNNHPSNDIIEIQDDSDPVNLDVGNGHDFNDKKGPTQPKKNMKSRKEDNESKSVELQPNKSQPKTKKYVCNDCNYTIGKRYLILRHEKKHFEKCSSKNTVSKSDFKTHSTLQNHVNNYNSKKPYRCQSCHKAFIFARYLFRHVQYKHTHEKPYKCTICGYACVEKFRLRCHEKNMHTPLDIPIQCKSCSDLFPDRYQYKVHSGSYRL